MSPGNLRLIAHLAQALDRYVAEAGALARQNGGALPTDLLSVAAFVADCARTSQDATVFGTRCPTSDAEQVFVSHVLTKQEVAAALRVSQRQVDRLIAAQQLPAVKIGSTTRIRRADLDRYVDALSPAAVVGASS